MSDKVATFLMLGIVLFMLVAGTYSGIAWSMFQYRNPTANRMAYWRNFVEVHRFEVLPEYQPK